jgi:hypothetical protein
MGDEIGAEDSSDAEATEHNLPNYMIAAGHLDAER